MGYHARPMRRHLPLALFASALFTPACEEAPVSNPPPQPTAEATAPVTAQPPPPAAFGPPKAAQRPAVNAYHGTSVTDDYQWLEASTDPEVKAWSDAENTHARRYLDAAPDRDALRARFRV